MSTHTPGPWRWEINFQNKRVHLVGGLRPQYDLTIIDFERWGMGSATMRLRDPEYDGMNLMHKLHERPDWVAPFEGRQHHAHWCANVTHPDARLIAAAPEMFDLLTRFAAHTGSDDPRLELVRATRALLARVQSGESGITTNTGVKP